MNVMLLSTPNRLWLGAVELFVNDEWGRVCSDTWDLTDASVLCQQLGYYGALEATALTTDLPSGLYWLAGQPPGGVKSRGHDKLLHLSRG